MKRLMSLVIGTVVIVLIAITTILGVEGGASWYLFLRNYRDAGLPSVASRSFVITDTTLGWRNKAGVNNPDAFGKGASLTLGAHGERLGVMDGAVAASPDAPRIVCSGDSYTFGMGVADSRTWCTQLQQTFPGTQTANFSQPDFGFDQLVLWYQQVASTVKPALHIWAVTDAELEKAAQTNVSGRNKPYVEASGNTFVVRNEPVPAQSESELRRAMAKREYENLRIVQVARKLTHRDRDDAATRAMDASWPVYDHLVGLVAEAGKDGGQSVIMYLPTTRDRREGVTDKRREQLKQIAAKYSLPFLDLTPAYRSLRADSADHLFIFPPPGGSVRYTGQLSNMGHEWVAKTLSPMLQPLMSQQMPSATQSAVHASTVKPAR